MVPVSPLSSLSLGLKAQRNGREKQQGKTTQLDEHLADLKNNKKTSCINLECSELKGNEQIEKESIVQEMQRPNKTT